jgi:arylsulfatase A-like enzyme
MPAAAFRRVRLAVAVIAAAGTCSSSTTVVAAPPKQPNVLFILTDDQRPDTIRELGNKHIETPHLDGLVRSGTIFNRAVSPNPICVSSRAEILTGCTGFRNGGFDNSNRLNPALVTWPKAMRAAGYRTCLVGKWHLAGRPTDHGFDETRGLFTPVRSRERARAGRITVALSADAERRSHRARLLLRGDLAHGSTDRADPPNARRNGTGREYAGRLRRRADLICI